MRSAVLGRHQPRKYLDATAADNKIVVTFSERLPAHLIDLQAPADVAVLRRLTIEANNSVRQAVQMLVFAACAVVYKKYRAPLTNEMLLQSEDLPTVTQ